MFKKEISKIMSESDLMVYQQDQVVDLFNYCFYKYLIDGKEDITFDTTELNNLWFYVKVKLLSQNLWDERCRKLLSKLLNKYAKKYENPKYRII